MKQNESQIPERERHVLAKARRCDDGILLVYACVLGESGRKSDEQTEAPDSGEGLRIRTAWSWCVRSSCKVGW